jgi:hypothetical protein
MQKKASKKNNKFAGMRNVRKDIKIDHASFVEGYKLSVTFNTGEIKIVDFGNFITENKFPFLTKYKEQKYFKNFKIEEGNIVWGKDWDLIFPIKQIYNGRILL